MYRKHLLENFFGTVDLFIIRLSTSISRSSFSTTVLHILFLLLEARLKSSGYNAEMVEAKKNFYDRYRIIG